MSCWDAQLVAVERVCCCTMLSRPWWTHEPVCEQTHRTRFFAAWADARHAFYNRDAA